MSFRGGGGGGYRPGRPGRRGRPKSAPLPNRWIIPPQGTGGHSINVHRMPPELVDMFMPRHPIEAVGPKTKHAPVQLTGLAAFVSKLKEADAKESESASGDTAEPPQEYYVSRLERTRRRQARARARNDAKIAAQAAEFAPDDNPLATGDPYRTLFVARLAYQTTEETLKKLFEHYGPITKIRMVSDNKTGRPRGYAFIEYEKVEDMKMAYKCADGIKVDGKRLLIDAERGRTMRAWKPRRLAGGLGGRLAKKRVFIAAPAAPRRGGGRGGRGGRGRGGGRFGGPPRGGYGGPPRSYGGPPRGYGGPPRGYDRRDDHRRDDHRRDDHRRDDRRDDRRGEYRRDDRRGDDRRMPSGRWQHDRYRRSRSRSPPRRRY